jgi:hypothetical protein
VSARSGVCRSPLPTLRTRISPHPTDGDARYADAFRAEGFHTLHDLWEELQGDDEHLDFFYVMCVQTLTDKCVLPRTQPPSLAFDCVQTLTDECVLSHNHPTLNCVPLIMSWAGLVT